MRTDCMFVADVPCLQSPEKVALVNVLFTSTAGQADRHQPGTDWPDAADLRPAVRGEGGSGGGSGGGGEFGGTAESVLICLQALCVDARRWALSGQAGQSLG